MIVILGVESPTLLFYLLSIALHDQFLYLKIFVEYVGGSGQPQIFVNRQNIGLTRTNVEQKRGEVLDLVAQNAMQNSSVGFDAQATIQNEVIKVKADFELAQNLDLIIFPGVDPT